MKKLLYIFLFVPFALFGQENDPCYSINDYNLLTELNNPQIEINLVSGWNMIGYPCTQEVIVSDAFSSIVNEISIVKDNNGNVYMPEFSFNGIGFLEGGQGYQIKMTDFVVGFTFCQSIQFPTIEGCTDCEAVNFSKLATTDDGSCNYDSDGDGIVDSLEIVGCQDESACDYNELATDSGECTYADDGYDCEGNQIFEIGDIANGGIVFYVDDSKQRGLVVSDTILFSLSEYFYFGCTGTNLNTISNESIGVGLENSIKISANCNEEFNAASGALNFEKYGYDDWYLPSFYELEILNSNLGFGSDDYDEDFNQSFGGHFFWSSTENQSDLNCSWGLYFYTGEEANPYCNGRWSVDAIRPIRLFGDWDIGCVDETACNFDENAEISNSTLCEYPGQGYDCDGNIIAQIGDIMEGGIVFYIDETGQHGLVAAMEDIQETYEWGCYGAELTGAGGLAIGTGYQNTLDIVSGCSETPIAVSVAIAYESGGYSDWYLPSKDELIEMYSTIGSECSESNIFGFECYDYWSSSQSDSYHAWPFHFEFGTTHVVDKTNTYGTRPIRAFGNWTMGCMDETACNFNPEANMADGSCTYPDLGYDCDGNITAEIGDVMEGGYLFYIDDSGTRGLVAATEDIGPFEWGCYQTELSGADGTSIGVGYQNTLDIVAGCSQTPIAASEALVYESNGFDDWYLPSKDELTEMYNSIGYGGNQGNIGDFVSNFYWSSSENDSVNYGWGTNFSNGWQTVTNYSEEYTAYVRPIRAFGNWIMGCMDPLACNYDTGANTDDESCEYPLEENIDCNGNPLINCFYPPDPEFVSWLQENTEGVMNGDCLDIDAAGEVNTSISIYNTNITNLDGLHYFTNLNLLYIDYNDSLTSIPDLSGLTNLSGLYIDNNESLTSLADLSGLTNLSELFIYGNESLTSLPDLSGLTNLDQLYIAYNDALECVGGYPEQLTIQEDWPPVCEEEVTYQVGDLAEGGIVFYVDETGQHGLVAAMEDLTEGATDPYGWGFNGYEWGCYMEYVDGADGTSIGTGYQNTMDIINQGCTSEEGGITAAQVALDAEINGFSDWYLPSKDELVEMYNTIGSGGQEGNVGGFSDVFYWSSSEFVSWDSWGIDFSNGSDPTGFKSNTWRVRVIRSF